MLNGASIQTAGIFSSVMCLLLLVVSVLTFFIEGSFFLVYIFLENLRRLRRDKYGSVAQANDVYEGGVTNFLDPENNEKSNE